jgi:hypothetical protein
LFQHLAECRFEEVNQNLVVNEPRGQLEDFVPSLSGD